MAATSSSSPIFFLTIMIIFLFQSSNAAYNVNVMSYGAKPDGKTDSTQPFLKAWSSACKSTNPTTIYVPKGTFLIKAVVFGGPCKSRIVFKIDGTLVAPSNYWNLGNSGYWILFSKVARVSIYGGSINARGSGFWACRRGGRSCPAGARLHPAAQTPMAFTYNRLTGVTISGSTIMTGDDCISLSQGSKNVWIEQIGCGPGHGISIGSLGDYQNEEGVQNITVTSSVFTKTQNGVRIKSWARASNGYARNIVFRNLIMKNVGNPIIIDQNYCPDKKGCPHQSSGVKISGVTYRNIKGTSATPVAMSFDCLSSNPCSGIKLQDIKLTYNGKSSSSYCKNAHGSSSGTVIPRSCLQI
ncbi:hypothetical protein Patl1_27024 [Pistacia atlantica]|uniref:Uncharacterized protein n=1 Tax=Pistacia atlantica TaxID=434234 RepID=A0ACC1B292_9ROSI|nr:hypothetical protein Patl1_27024 [Pistacia atlantica]